MSTTFCARYFAKKIFTVDKKILTSLFEAQAPKLKAYLRKFLGDADAEDALQDAFERLLHAPRVNDANDATAWLYRVAHNRAIDVLRAQKKTIAGEEYLFNEKSTPATQEIRLLRKERDALIEKAAQQFDTKGRGTLAYHLLRETPLTPEKMAHALGMAPRTCRRFVDNLFIYIQNELQKNGYTREDL